MNKPLILLAGFRTLRKGLGVVQSEFTSVHQAAFTLALAGVVAKILALLRDRMLAATFGAGVTLDVYYAAFRVPDFIYTLSLFIAASTALIPIMIEREAVGREETKKFISVVTSWFVVAMIIIGAISYLAMPLVTKIVTPGFNADNQTTVRILSQILLLQAVLLGLSSIASTIIQGFKKFIIYSLSPIVYNFGIIAGILFLYPRWGLIGITIGVVAGATLHLLVQLPSTVALGLFPKFSLAITPAIKRAVFLSLPRTLGLSFNQFVAMAVTAIASTLSAGSITVFNLADNLQGVPLTIIGVSYSIAAFPFLASIAAKENVKEFLVYFSSAFRHIVFWSLPATALIIVLRAHIVRVVLGAGNFGWADTRLTAAALALFTVSLLAQGLTTLYIRAFYAAGETKMPLLINGMGAVLTVILSLVLVQLYLSSETFRLSTAAILRVSDIKNSAILMLPLAFSIGSLTTLFLLAYGFRKNWGPLGDKKFLYSMLQISGASLAAGIAAFGILRVFDDIFNLETFTGIFAHGALSGIVGIIASALFLIFIKNRELLEIQNALKPRFWKTRIITAREPSIGTEL